MQREDPEKLMDYLLDCSDTSLDHYMLSRLERAVNLRKELHQVVDEWVEALANARSAKELRAVRRRKKLAKPQLMPKAVNQ